MNESQYEILNKSKALPCLITINDLEDKSDRTLLYGYTCSRDTWHVYIKDGEIFTVVYDFQGDPTLVLTRDNESYIPGKRLYPARCDFEFCTLLKAAGVYLPFTTFEKVELQGTYFGEVL